MPFPELQTLESPQSNSLYGSDMGLSAVPGPQIDPVLAADIYQAMQTAKDQDKSADQQTVNDIVAIWDNLYTRWYPFFRRAYKMYRYLRTDQINKEVREQLRRDRRPELEFNYLLRLIVYMGGMIAKNKSRMQANPITPGKEMKAKLHTLINEWAMNNCDGDYEIARAAVNAAICGIGWTNNYWDANAGDGGLWRTKSTTIFNVMFDVDARTKEDQQDWKYETYHDYFTAEDIVTIYGLKGEDAQAVMKAAEDLEGPYKGRRTPKGMMGRVLAGILDFVDPYGQEEKHLREGVDNWMDLKSGLYRVVEFHDVRTIFNTELYDPLSRHKVIVPDIVEKDMELRRRFVQEQYKGYMERRTSRTENWITAVCPKLLMTKPLVQQAYPVQGHGFQFKPIFWYDFDPDPIETRGILDNLIGSIDFNNQRMMSFLNWIMKGVTPDVKAREKSIDPSEIDTWKSKEHGRLLFYKGDKAPEEAKIDAQVGSALSNSAEGAIEHLQDLSGITPNSMGRAETSKEGVGLYTARVQSGMVMLEHGFSHVQRSQEQIFEYCDGHLQMFLTMPRMIRIVGEPPKGMEGVQMDETTKNAYWLKLNWEDANGTLNDLTDGEYDFKADPTQLGQTTKQANFIVKSDLLGKLPEELQLIFAPYVVGAADDPDAAEISSKMQKFVDAKLGIAEQQMQMQLLEGQQKLAAQQKQLTAPDVNQEVNQGAEAGAVA